MSDPRCFVCPSTDHPCAEDQCNYKASDYCLRGEREDFAVRSALAEKARISRQEEDRLAEKRRKAKHRKELRRRPEIDESRHIMVSRSASRLGGR